MAFLGYAWRLPVAVNFIISGVDLWNRAKASSLRLQEALTGDAHRPTAGERPALNSIQGAIDFNVERFVYPTQD